MSVKITAICVNAQPCLVQNLLLKHLEVRDRCKQGKLQLRHFDVDLMLYRLALLFAIMHVTLILYHIKCMQYTRS